MEDIPSFLPAILFVASLSLLPFAVVMATAYTKIVIVLMLLRNALGVQQAPSTLVVNSVGLALTVFILVPVGYEIAARLGPLDINNLNWEAAAAIYGTVTSVFTEYLQRFSSERELAFYMDAAMRLWPQEMHQHIHEENFFLLLPAHVTSEITRAFQIGFLLFLPFVIIDLVVSNILLSMGAMMVPPMLISLPIKILLFVATDGWSRLLHGLVISYA